MSTSIAALYSWNLVGMHTEHTKVVSKNWLEYSILSFLKVLLSLQYTCLHEIESRPALLLQTSGSVLQQVLDLTSQPATTCYLPFVSSYSQLVQSSLAAVFILLFFSWHQVVSMLKFEVFYLILLYSNPSSMEKQLWWRRKCSVWIIQMCYKIHCPASVPCAHLAWGCFLVLLQAWCVPL